MTRRLHRLGSLLWRVSCPADRPALRHTPTGESYAMSYARGIEVLSAVVFIDLGSDAPASYNSTTGVVTIEITTDEDGGNTGIGCTSI